MPLYDFECKQCTYYDEIRQAHDAPSILECPCCDKKTLRKVFINPPAISIRGEPTTIAQLGDKNTRNMGHYEKQDRSAKDNPKNKSEAQKKREVNRKINGMTDKEKVKWIKEGDS